MTKAKQLDKSKTAEVVKRAHNIFDKWNDVTGVFEKHSGYYAEIQGVIEDVVLCSIQSALGTRRTLEGEDCERCELCDICE